MIELIINGIFCVLFIFWFVSNNSRKHTSDEIISELVEENQKLNERILSLEGRNDILELIVSELKNV